MGWLITRSPSGGFTRVFAEGLGVPLMDAVLDLAKISQPPKAESIITARKLSRSEMRRRETIARNEALRAFYAQGKTITWLAQHYKISERTVYPIVVRGKKREAREKGIEYKRASRITEEDKQRRAEMLAMREQGKTLQEIGIAKGITRERVRQIVGTQAKGRRMEVMHNKVKQALTQEVDLTAQELAGELGVSEALVRKLSSGKRFKIKDENSAVGKGAKWEEWVHEILVSRGIENQLMPHGHPFDILALGKVRIDVKAREVRGTTVVRDAYTFSIRNIGNADFYVFIIPEHQRVFVVPASMDLSTCIRIPWPPKKRKTKYIEFGERWDLIERFASGEEIPVPTKRVRGEKRCGTWYSYSTGCRCDLCKAAASEYNKTKHPNLAGKRNKAQHGTTTMYGKYKCRCELCVKAQRDYYQSHKKAQLG